MLALRRDLLRDLLRDSLSDNSARSCSVTIEGRGGRDLMRERELVETIIQNNSDSEPQHRTRVRVYSVWACVSLSLSFSRSLAVCVCVCVCVCACMCVRPAPCMRTMRKPVRAKRYRVLNEEKIHNTRLL